MRSRTRWPRARTSRSAADQALHAALSVIPNTPREDVPEGKDEHGNVEQRKVGTPPKLVGINKPLQHFEIGERLGLMDFETAAKLSGARFVVLKGALARMERALGAFMLDLHTRRRRAVSAATPRSRRRSWCATMRCTARRSCRSSRTINSHVIEWLGADESEIVSRPGVTSRRSRQPSKDLTTARADRRYAGPAYALKEQAEFAHVVDRETICWLIPTAEVPLTNLVREKITDEAELPIRVTAFTPCFRAEAGAAGKDTRGMIRQHQFSKVELVSITTPEQSSAEHERMTACAEEVLKRLGLAYRTMLLCTGDMGFASQKTYDIEVWLPGQDTYREISSCSVCGDFQARRMNARYRPKGGKGTEFVHTLNGSGLAVGRTLVAILENYQQADGSVAIPDALQPYMGGLKKIEAAYCRSVIRPGRSARAGTPNPYNLVRQPWVRGYFGVAKSR